jgi:hypothetical protein
MCYSWILGIRCMGLTNERFEFSLAAAEKALVDAGFNQQ